MFMLVVTRVSGVEQLHFLARFVVQMPRQSRQVDVRHLGDVQIDRRREVVFFYEQRIHQQADPFLCVFLCV